MVSLLSGARGICGEAVDRQHSKCRGRSEGCELLVSAKWYKGFRAQAEFFSHHKPIVMSPYLILYIWYDEQILIDGTFAGPQYN